jgi:hypothetical protein
MIFSTNSGYFIEEAATPPIDPSLIFWLDASDLSSFTLSAGSKVEGWNDKSGNGNDLIELNEPQRPLYAPTGWDGTRPCVSFSTGVKLTGDPLSEISDGSFTFFIVFNTPVGTAGPLISFTTGFIVGDGYFSNFNNSSYYYPGGNAWMTGPPVTVKTVLSSVFRAGGTVDSRHYHGDTLVNSVLENKFIGFGTNTLELGARAGGTGELIGDICEIRFYDESLSDVGRSAVGSELTSKWAV